MARLVMVAMELLVSKVAQPVPPARAVREAVEVAVEREAALAKVGQASGGVPAAAGGQGREAQAQARNEKAQQVPPRAPPQSVQVLAAPVVRGVDVRGLPAAVAEVVEQQAAERELEAGASKVQVRCPAHPACPPARLQLLLLLLLLTGVLLTGVLCCVRLFNTGGRGAKAAAAAAKPPPKPAGELTYADLLG